ncbi:MAG: S16 family serine protease [Candidatus Bathyarchaeota archaeon]
MYGEDEERDVDAAEVKRRGRGLLALSLVINVALASMCGYFYLQDIQLSGQVAEQASSLNELSLRTMALEQQLNMSASQLDYYKELSSFYAESASSSDNSSGLIGHASVPILAVQTSQSFLQASYKGYVLHADVDLVEGQGRVLVNTEVINGMDIQASVRTAATVVESLLGVSFSGTDIILTVRAEESVEAVDGPSAGGAITVAIMAAIGHNEIVDGVYMTGTINSDGSIGEVGGVPYKALAAAEAGAKVVLVPMGLGTVTLYKPVTVTRGRISYTTYEKVTLGLEEYLLDNGYTVRVVEVGSVSEAYEEFTGLTL